MQQYSDPNELAAALERRFKDHLCVVTLECGRDDIGKARMEVEDVYYDADVDQSRVLRIVGRQTEGADHAMFGLPLGEGTIGCDLSDEDDRCTLEAGHHRIVIVPEPVDRNALSDRPV